MHECLTIEYGNPRARDDVQQKRDELDRIAELLRKVRLDALGGSDIAEELNDIQRDDIERWLGGRGRWRSLGGSRS